MLLYGDDADEVETGVQSIKLLSQIIIISCRDR